MKMIAAMVVALLMLGSAWAGEATEKTTAKDWGCGPDPLRVDQMYRAHIKSRNRSIIFGDVPSDRVQKFLAAFNRTKPLTAFTADSIYFVYRKDYSGAHLVLVDSEGCVLFSHAYAYADIKAWMRGEVEGEQKI